jgi:branched-chain amino acid transport system ATP-binding protein
MLLETSGITVHYGGAICLKDISLKVEPGEIVTIIGSNGAGKTTTLRSIAGLKKLTGGEIRFKGQRIDGIPAQDVIRKGIAHVQQGRNLFTYMSVMENLKLGAYLRHDKNRIKEDLQKIFQAFPILQARRRQEARTLSGGEQQMLAIARALMSDPTLLLLDEPSIGLAPIIVQEISKIAREINQKGTSILLVEQNSRMALKLAHRGYVLESGTLVLEGRGEDLMRDDRVKKAYLGE